MSWQAYVKDQLMVPGEMCSAAMYGMDGGEWAGDGCVRPSPDEVKRIIALIQDTETNYEGITLAGQGYMFLNKDISEGVILLARKGAPSENENYQAVAHLANTCLVFGVVAGTYRRGNCVKTVCRLREYLKSVGY